MTFKDFNFCPHSDYANIGKHRFCDCMKNWFFCGIVPLRFVMTNEESKKVIEDFKKTIGFTKKNDYWIYYKFYYSRLSSRIKNFCEYKGKLKYLAVSEFYYKYKKFMKTKEARDNYFYDYYKRIADTYENTEYHKQTLRYSKKLL